MARKTNRTTLEVLGDTIVAEEKYYLGNKGVPTPDSQYEWTPKMIEALRRCKVDIVYFAENFFTIIDRGVRKHIPLRKYQKEFLTTMVNENRVILLTGRQSGKCVCKNTLIKLRHKKLNINITIPVWLFFYYIKTIKFFKKLLSL